jgi:ribosomal protein S18 acetylase RimI-like enzyme
MEPVLRPLTREDYAAYLERVDELDALHREALPEFFRKPEGEPPRTMEFFEGLLGDPNVLLLGAWVDGELAGYAHAFVRDVEQRWLRVGRRDVVLDNLAVGPRWQRRGLGLALVEAVTEWARQRGAQQLQLDVWEVNGDALRFYESIGFATQRRHLARSLGPPRPP